MHIIFIGILLVQFATNAVIDLFLSFFFFYIFNTICPQKSIDRLPLKVTLDWVMK